MSDDLTKEQRKELEQILEQILKEAKNVVDDYINTPSQISGSTEIRIQEDSPWLDETKSFVPLTRKKIRRNKKD